MSRLKKLKIATCLRLFNQYNDMKDVGLVFSLVAWFIMSANGQTTLKLMVDMNRIDAPESVWVRGSHAPLSWDRSLFMTDVDEDGIYEIHVTFDTADTIEFKFGHGNNRWELPGDDNRRIILNDTTQYFSAIFNNYRPGSLDIKNSIVFTERQIREDLEIMREALLTVHPNLFRYFQQQHFEAGIENLKKDISDLPTLANMYREITQFIAKIKCGHTKINQYNQPSSVKKAILMTEDKLPFCFTWLQDKMIVTDGLNHSEKLSPGDEIVSINGDAGTQIFKTLRQHFSVDGTNPGKLANGLSIFGKDRFEFFDGIFSICFPTQDGTFNLQIKKANADTISHTVSGITKGQRRMLVKTKKRAGKENKAPIWDFDIVGTYGLLTIGTHAVWDLDLDWKDLIDSAVDQMSSENIQHFVIDIRGNSGGADMVNVYLASKIIAKDLIVKQTPGVINYRKIPAQLRPHFNTWSDDVYDLSDRVQPNNKGQYVEKKIRTEYTVKAHRRNFAGTVYLITDASNSSATHYLAKTCKEYGLATLVGQETGGNMKGMNGGQVFFVTLPNAQIEIDIPIYGSADNPAAPNQGVEPDHQTLTTAQDIRDGIDPQLRKIEMLIQHDQKGSR